SASRSSRTPSPSRSTSAPCRRAARSPMGARSSPAGPPSRSRTATPPSSRRTTPASARPGPPTSPPDASALRRRTLRHPIPPPRPRQARLFDAGDYAGPLFEKRARRVAVAPDRHERMAWGLADLARSTGHTDQDVPTAVAVAVLVYHVYLRERTDRLEAAFEGRPVP